MGSPPSLTPSIVSVTSSKPSPGLFSSSEGGNTASIFLPTIPTKGFDTLTPKVAVPIVVVPDPGLQLPHLGHLSPGRQLKLFGGLPGGNEGLLEHRKVLLVLPAY